MERLRNLSRRQVLAIGIAGGVLQVLLGAAVGVLVAMRVFG